MRTLGVDLASQPANTGLCLVDWNVGSVVGLAVGRDDEGPLDDDAVLRWARDADVVGIDAPFGWPDPFVAAVAGWHRGDAWPHPPPDRDELRFRRTDRAVRPTMGGRWPLSVSTDLIGVTALRCARLLAAAEHEHPGSVDRSGVTGRFVETYPAAGLRAWGLPHAQGYKGTPGALRRQEIVDGFRSGPLGPFLVGGTAAALAASDHALDAFVAALLARGRALGGTLLPDRADLETARREGWIHIPAPDRGLATLLTRGAPDAQDPPDVQEGR